MLRLKFHKLLYTLTFYCLFVGIGCSAGSFMKNSKVSIDNPIKECFQIKQVSKLIHNNLILLDTELSVIKNIGYCGCKSAILSYGVTTRPVELNGRTKEYKLFSSLREGKYTFVLDGNGTQNKNKSYTLIIQCASPD